MEKKENKDLLKKNNKKVIENIEDESIYEQDTEEYTDMDLYPDEIIDDDSIYEGQEAEELPE